MFIISTAAPGFFGRTTRTVTGALVSHSLGIYWSLDFDAWVLMEALVGRGFVPMPAKKRLAELRRDGRIVHRLHMDATSEKGFLCRIFEDAWGSSYDLGLTVGWFFPALANRMKWRGKEWFPKWNSPGALNCSEAFSSSLVALGYKPFWPSMHPGQLADALDQANVAERVEPEALWSRIEEGVR